MILKFYIKSSDILDPVIFESIFTKLMDTEITDPDIREYAQDIKEELVNMAHKCASYAAQFVILEIEDQDYSFSVT